jgi:(p)ppGpp synthase/HD superfamily hydrolase
MLTKKFDDALVFAHQLHRNQVRKDTRIPYVAHLMSASALVLENAGDEDQAIAALLHDAVEDQGGEATLRAIQQRFGNEVAAMVRDCSDSLPDDRLGWRARKENYLDSLHLKPKRSLLVSLAGKTHNAECILQDFHEPGATTLWARYSEGVSGVRWYYQKLVGIFSEKMSGPLADRFARAVHGFCPTLSDNSFKTTVFPKLDLANLPKAGQRK